MKITYAPVIVCNNLLSRVSGLHVTSSIANMTFTPLFAASRAALVLWGRRGSASSSSSVTRPEGCCRGPSAFSRLCRRRSLRGPVCRKEARLTAALNTKRTVAQADSLGIPDFLKYFSHLTFSVCSIV